MGLVGGVAEMSEHEPRLASNQILMDHDFASPMRIGAQIYVNTWLNGDLDSEALQDMIAEEARVRKSSK